MATVNINGLDDILRNAIHPRIEKAIKHHMSDAKSRLMRTIALRQGGCVQSYTYVLVLYLNFQDIPRFDGGYIIDGIYVSKLLSIIYNRRHDVDPIQPSTRGKAYRRDVIIHLSMGYGFLWVEFRFWSTQR